MRGLLGLIIIVSNEIMSSKAQNQCPVDGPWTYCGGKGSVCHINGDVDQGYISFGGNGIWGLIPFINMKDKDTQLDVSCEENLGLTSGYTECCWIARRNGFLDLSTQSWRGRKEEGQTFSTPANTNYKDKTYTVIFGIVDRYIIRPVVNVAIPCSTSFFGDPGAGTQKKCNWKSVAPLPTRDADNWVTCANENGDCDGLESNKAYWVRFGSGTNKKYFFRMVISHTGSIPCTKNTFGDPEPDAFKYCDRAEDLDFQDRGGRWKKLQSCGGCGTQTYQKKRGVSESVTVTNSWSTTVTASFEASFVAGTRKVSGSVSRTVTESQSSSFEQNVAVTQTYDCEKESFYGWVFEGLQLNGIDDPLAFEVATDAYECIYGSEPPKCLPTYCDRDADENCQVCTTTGGTISALPNVMLPSLHDMNPNEVVRVYEPQPYEPNGEVFDEKPFPIGVPSYINYSDFLWFVFGCVNICCAVVNILAVIWSNCSSDRRRSHPYSAGKCVPSDDDLEANE